MKEIKKTKDFGSLFITNTAEKKDLTQNHSDETIKEIEPGDCINWQYADRQEFEMGDLQELAMNIAENGQVQPIVVRKKNDKYEVIAGERRWRACSLINKKVKVVIKKLTDEEAFLLQAAENMKQDLSCYSKSISYQKILDSEKMTQRSLAKQLGISKSTLNNLLAFSLIPKELWDAVGDMRKVTVKTACYIKQLLNEEKVPLQELIVVANEIQKGAGSSKIRKLLQKDAFIAPRKICSTTGKMLFKVEQNKIVLPINELDEKSTNELTEYLQRFFEERSS